MTDGNADTHAEMRRRKFSAGERKSSRMTVEADKQDRHSETPPAAVPSQKFA